MYDNVAAQKGRAVALDDAQLDLVAAGTTSTSGEAQNTAATAADLLNATLYPQTSDTFAPPAAAGAPTAAAPAQRRSLAPCWATCGPGPDRPIRCPAGLGGPVRRTPNAFRTQGRHGFGSGFAQ
jgi:hypothetical protein